MPWKVWNKPINSFFLSVSHALYSDILSECYVKKVLSKNLANVKMFIKYAKTECLLNDKKKRIFADDYLLLFSFICLRSRPVDSNFVHSLVCELPCWNDMWWDDREERVTWWQEALITIDCIVYFHIFSLSKFKRTADLLSLWSAFIAQAQIQQYVQNWSYVLVTCLKVSLIRLLTNKM